jgi:hypothetical protein
MNLKNQQPVFVPFCFRAEIEKHSKAALMDMVWDLATRCAGSELVDGIMAEVRSTGEIVEAHRKQERAS